jgi:hypothetical protein
MKFQKTKEWLAHPLFLLLIGALISSYLIPSWTRRWQDHQKELELKTDLLGEINDSVMGMIMKIQVAEVLLKGTSQENYDEAVSDMQSYYLKWMVEKEVIGSNIRAFFPKKADIGRKWDDLVTSVHYLEGLSEISDEAKRREYLHKFIQDRLAEGEGIIDWDKLAKRDLSSWLELSKLIVKQKGELEREIIKSRITSF